MNLKHTLTRNLLNIPGWRTNRKLLIIESDDWGSIRTKDNDSIKKLSKQYPHFGDDVYSRYDTLESNDDLEALFDVLTKVKDKNGSPALLTANTIVGNPNFEKIANDNFDQYYFEPFTATYKRYENRDRVEQLIFEGINKGIYHPQFHGREHLNVGQWMTSLKNKHKELRAAFSYEMFGVPLKEKISSRRNVMASLDLNSLSELSNQKKILSEGQKLFDEIFKFKSKTFIAPSYIWHPDIEKYLHDVGVRILQGFPYQYIPIPDKYGFGKKFRYTGKVSESGMLNLSRNAYFEPSIQPSTDAVNECLHRISLAFKMRKPAIVGTHRINFMGALDEKNRTNSLKLFHDLLRTVTTRWPDVEFVSSDTLGELMINSK